MIQITKKKKGGCTYYKPKYVQSNYGYWKGTHWRAILYRYQHGHSCRKIAETVNCGASAVSACLRRYKATGSTDTKPRSGRPRLLETPDHNRLKRLVTKNEKTRRLCVGAIQDLWEKKTNQKVSTPTLRRTLHIAGLGDRVARQKPFISPDNIVKRLAWARSHQHWTVKDWGKVLWSDESTFTQFQQVHKRVWREPSEEWSTTCVSATVKHPPSRMFRDVFGKRNRTNYSSSWHSNWWYLSKDIGQTCYPYNVTTLSKWWRLVPGW